MTHNKKTLRAGINLIGGAIKCVDFDKFEMYKDGSISFKDSRDGVLDTTKQERIKHMVITRNG